MLKYVSENDSDDTIYDEEYFRQRAIDLSNESIANLRRELDEMKEK